MHSQVTMTPDMIACSIFNSRAQYDQISFRQNREIMFYLPYRVESCL